MSFINRHQGGDFFVWFLIFLDWIEIPNFLFEHIIFDLDWEPDWVPD